MDTTQSKGILSLLAEVPTSCEATDRSEGGFLNLLSCLTRQKQFQDAKNAQLPFAQWAGLGSRNSGVRSQAEEAPGLRVGEQSGIQIPHRGKAHVIKPRHSVRTEAEQQRCMESGLLPILPQENRALCSLCQGPTLELCRAQLA